MKNFYIYGLFKKNKLDTHCQVLPEINNKKIVVVSPHADDIAIGCGGAMALLSATNTITPLLFFTGERGIDAPDKQQRIKIRETEMCAEARELGLCPPIFLRLSSYDHEHQENLSHDKAQLEKVLRELTPDIIFLPHENDCQPRHQLASDITMAVLKVINFTGALFFYETPWEPFASLDFNLCVVLEAAVMAQKIRAIRVHASQLKRTRFDRAAQGLAQFRAAVVPEQRMQGYGSCACVHFKYVEVFLYRPSIEFRGRNHS
jgi:LmbE family N-acetylglucosaminyl deacetylase